MAVLSVRNAAQSLARGELGSVDLALEFPEIVSMIIVIMGVTVLEHFIRWEQPNEIVLFGGTLALVVAALVLFQFQSHRSKAQRKNDPDTQTRVQRQLFHEDREERECGPTKSGAPGTD